MRSVCAHASSVRTACALTQCYECYPGFSRQQDQEHVVIYLAVPRRAGDFRASIPSFGCGIMVVNAMSFKIMRWSLVRVLTRSGRSFHL